MESIINVVRAKDGLWELVDYCATPPKVHFRGRRWECWNLLLGMVGSLELLRA